MILAELQNELHINLANKEKEMIDESLNLEEDIVNLKNGVRYVSSESS